MSIEAERWEARGPQGRVRFTTYQNDSESLEELARASGRDDMTFTEVVPLNDSAREAQARRAKLAES